MIVACATTWAVLFCGPVYNYGFVTGLDHNGQTGKFFKHAYETTFCQSPDEDLDQYITDGDHCQDGFDAICSCPEPDHLGQQK